MPTFKNTWELEQFLQMQIDSVLEHEVAQIAKDEMQIAVNNVVYGAGDPTEYVRRGGNAYGGMGNTVNTGSLADQSQMEATVKDGVLEITNIAEFNHEFALTHNGYGGVDRFKSLAQNIIEGYQSKKAWWNEPRPFITEAINQLESGNEHVEAMKEGLQKKLGRENIK